MRQRREGPLVKHTSLTHNKPVGRLGWRAVMHDWSFFLSPGAAMKRVFLIAGMVILCSTWANQAHAQLGLFSLARDAGSGPPLGIPLTQMKKPQVIAPAPPPLAGISRAHNSRSTRAPIGLADRVRSTRPGGPSDQQYAAIRGELYGPGAAECFARGSERQRRTSDPRKR